ncbi:MAG: hypothetical protein V4557_09885 [Bacteroidota bacterium]
MRTKRIIWLVLALILGAAVFWWTTIKEKIVKNAVTKAVQKKTDSLYRITYEKSEIDEIAGNAYLYNVQVKIDSAQWLKLIEKDSMPPVTIAATIAKITISGLKELKLLNNSSLDVTSIVLDKPVFRLDKWARKHPPAEGLNDTVEIYKRLVGNFDFLRAKNIQVIDGNFTLIDQFRKQAFAANGINITIDDFLVDSAHNYRNISSYFIKQTRATINTVSSNNIRTSKIEYDSKQHFLNVKDLTISGDAPVSARSIEINGLSTEQFISQGHVNARSLVLNSPNITIKSNAKKKKSFELIASAASVDSFIIQKGNLNVYTKTNKLVSIKDVQLLMKGIKTVDGKLPIEEYMNATSCLFSIGSIKLPMELHSMQLQGITYPNTSEQVKIGSLQVRPTMTRQQVKTRIGIQTAMYNIAANNITINKIDLKKIIKENTVSIHDISLRMNLHVFSDKALEIDSVKKGHSLFPYDGLRTSKTKIDIRAIAIRDSKISYEEHAPKSGRNGTVFFTGVDGRLTNITNMASQLEKDNTMKLEAVANVMGVAPMRTNWDMLLNSPDVNFKVTGSVSPFPISILNPPFEALSMTSMRSGFADKLSFEINGQRMNSTGTVLLNYHDLKIDLLRKNKEDSLEKKGFLSFIANADIKNNNTSPKPKTFNYQKDRYKSFFNLLWKSVFEGGKNTILIVK